MTEAIEGVHSPCDISTNTEDANRITQERIRRRTRRFAIVAVPVIVVLMVVIIIAIPLRRAGKLAGKEKTQYDKYGS